MKQKYITTIRGLLGQSATAIDGAAKALPADLLQRNTGTAIATDRASLVTAVSDHETGKSTLAQRRAVLHSVTLTVRGFVKTTRELLKPYLGDKPSTAWDIVGFKRGTLQIPVSAEPLLVILERMQAYLTANAETQNTELSITPERASGLVTSLRAAKSEFTAQRGTVKGLLQARNIAQTNLRKRMRGLIDELDQVLDPLDGRWLTFGLNMPGAKQIPTVPQNVSAVLIGETAASVKWEASARAEYYRVWKKVGEGDAEFVTVGNPADLDFTMEELPRNSTIEIAVSAVNNGGESSRSQSIQIVTH